MDDFDKLVTAARNRNSLLRPRRAAKRPSLLHKPSRSIRKPRRSGGPRKDRKNSGGLGPHHEPKNPNIKNPHYQATAAFVKLEAKAATLWRKIKLSPDAAMPNENGHDSVSKKHWASPKKFFDKHLKDQFKEVFSDAGKGSVAKDAALVAIAAAGEIAGYTYFKYLTGKDWRTELPGIGVDPALISGLGDDPKDKKPKRKKHETKSTKEYLYKPLLRPAGFATLPSGIKWDYVETPNNGSVNRPDLPRSTHRHGIIKTDRELTKQEKYTFDLQDYP